MSQVIVEIGEEIFAISKEEAMDLAKQLLDAAGKIKEDAEDG